MNLLCDIQWACLVTAWLSAFTDQGTVVIINISQLFHASLSALGITIGMDPWMDEDDSGN